jgi:hypothetical protein
MYKVELFDRRILKGDIPQALKNNPTAVLVALNPVNEKFAGEVPQDIAIDYRGGVSASEIWLSNTVKQETFKRSQFDGERDNELVATGTFFWCKSCVVARPLAEKSPDDRYCQRCFDVLLKEAELEGRRAGDWRPQKGKRAAEPSTDSLLTADEDVSRDNAGCDTVTHKELVGGNGVTDLLTDRIRVLAGQGMSCRAIEVELAKEKVTVSYRTIARRLKGQGVLV